MKYDAVVTIGRRQPLHFGHSKNFIECAKLSKTVVVIVGSSFQSRSTVNPFLYRERKLMIENEIKTLVANGKIASDVVFRIAGVRDYAGDNVSWSCKVNEAVARFVNMENANIGLVGHNKDKSTFYLSLFPNMTFEETGEFNKNGLTWTATTIRNMLFDGHTHALQTHVSLDTYIFLLEFIETEAYTNISNEHKYVVETKAKDALHEYPPIRQTVDSVVFHKGYVLMGKRNGVVGHGLWAIPGGYLEPDETLLHGAYRELKEETDVDSEYIESGYLGSHRIGTVNRCAVGRVITEVFVFNLTTEDRPEATAGDDLAEVEWHAIENLPAMSETIFEDHYTIILQMAKKYNLNN